MVCLHISAKTKEKFTCWTPLTANRTPNLKTIKWEAKPCSKQLNYEENACRASRK
jgi:hypothetical protein